MLVLLRVFTICGVILVSCVSQSFWASDVAGGDVVVAVPIDGLCDSAINGDTERCKGTLSTLNDSSCFSLTGAPLVTGSYVKDTGTLDCSTQVEINMQTGQTTGSNCQAKTIQLYSKDCE